MRESVQPTDLEPEEVLATVRRIRESAAFAGAGRLQVFLQFVTDETLAGRGGQLKEYSIGLEVYRRPADFDPRTDSSVRVGATKLRARLEDYYSGTGVGEPVRISIPKGSYVPTFAKQPAATVVRWPRRWMAALLLAAAISCGALWVKQERLVVAMRWIPVTSGPQAAFNPSFSPDGTQVAFSSDLAEAGNRDIFIKSVDSGSLLRLTSDEAPDTHPAWSPDGKWIAFIRNDGYGGAAYLVSAEGGAEKKLRNLNMGRLAWSPDGGYLAALHRESQVDPPAFQLIHVATGETQPLTKPPKGWMDFDLAYSPDGRRAAVSRCSSTSRCDVYLAEVREDRKLVEPFQRLTSLQQSIHGIAWAGDGGTLVFSSGNYNDYRLWRVDTRQKDAVPEAMGGPATAAHYPTIPLRGPASLTRIAYQASTVDENIWAVPLGDAGRQKVLAPSPRGEWAPDLSADGTRLVFASDRSGTHQVWTSAADGTGLRPVTSFGTGIVLFPQWSPVNDTIAFTFFDTSKDNDERAIYTIRSDGTGLTRITEPEHQATEHSWSRDGKWIYFSSRATGQYQVWKAPAAGGAPERVTVLGGYHPIEAHGAIYYTITGDGVWKFGLTDRQARKVLPQARGGGWYPVRDGVLFIPPEQPDAGVTRVSHWDAATGAIRPVASLPHPGINRFSFHEGRGVALYARADHEIHDIAILENYGRR